MTPVIWAVLAGINVPVYVLVGKILFGTWEDFFNAIVYWFKPDLWSWLDGEYLEDFWAELRLGIMLTVCSGLVWVEGMYLCKPYLLPLLGISH